MTVEPPSVTPRWALQYGGDPRGTFGAVGRSLPEALMYLERSLFHDLIPGQLIPPDRAATYRELRQLLGAFAENRAQRRSRLVLPGGGRP